MDARGRELGPAFGVRGEVEDRLEVREWVSQGKAAPRVGGIPGAFPKPGSPSFPFSEEALSWQMLVFPGPPAPPSLPFLPLPSALQCCKAPHDSCRQKRTQGSCPGAALRRETVSALALGGAAWGSLGPCGVVSRVSAIESAVVARGGPAGSGTLNFFHPCW